jgi:hypothetical protein
MKCPRCRADCPDNGNCACGEAVRPRRRPRRRADAEEAPLSPEAEAFFRRARSVYGWALWSLLPPVGALLGPIAAAMAWRLRQQAPTPDTPGVVTLTVSLWMGTLTGLTQIAGAALIAASYWPWE